MRRYLFKVGSIDLADGRLLPGIVDFFAEGAAAGKDVAAFCDDLVEDSRTDRDAFPESVTGRPGTDQK